VWQIRGIVEHYAMRVDDDELPYYHHGRCHQAGLLVESYPLTNEFSEKAYVVGWALGEHRPISNLRSFKKL
jgi:hypothetical protein